MASSVFYRFRSQKEPSRITFDGTGISIFELKRDIITQNRLGDGSDFELMLSSDEGELYDDDTTFVPRSTSVVARRLPAQRPGKGGAARYVSGKMPLNAKNSHRVEAKPTAIQNAPSSGPGVSDSQTEDENMAAVLAMGSEQWAKRKQEMANDIAVPLKRGGPAHGKDIPDKPPPPGYVCYRCGEKGHWIQACPTNDDPNYVNRPRIKRTTGIPKSMLRKIDKPVILDGEDGALPAGVMVNAEGDWVIAKADAKTWEQLQAKVQKSAAAQEEAKQGSKELQEWGLECTLDRRLYTAPVKTPCCGTTYWHDCIDNYLLDNDLVCPNCKEEVLVEDLKSDEEMVAKIKAYEEEIKAKKAEVSANGVANGAMTGSAEPVDKPKVGTNGTSEHDASKSPESKKRKAEAPPDDANSRLGNGPPSAAPKGPSAQQQNQNQTMAGMMNPMMWGMPGMSNVPNMPNMPDMSNMPNMSLGGQWSMAPNGMPWGMEANWQGVNMGPTQYQGNGNGHRSGANLNGHQGKGRGQWQ